MQQFPGRPFMSRLVLSKVTICFSITNNFYFTGGGEQAVRGGVEKKVEEELKEKINKKVSTKFQINPSTND
jgi:hypothetical protein